MNIVQIDGGLGNQMFQYVFGLSIQKRNGSVYYSTKVVQASQQHNGLELIDVFKINLPTSIKSIFISEWIYLSNKMSGMSKMSQIFFGLINEKLLNINIVEEVNFAVFNEGVYNSLKNTLCYYKGYWQSSKYFEFIVSKSVFNFNLRNLNSETLEFKQFILKNFCVSVHIRRGDYLLNSNIESYGEICTKEYYLKAIEYFKNEFREINFIFFSDDIEWVKSIYLEDNYYFVDWNIHVNSWQDMYLMSLCSHNIIANSSFSWWGAYLNNNLNKIVIAPKIWHNLHDASDICPSKWIRL